jgi:LacI family transcriptional regulator, gluconate utilization system Gnt-I transcriptional repressor
MQDVAREAGVSPMTVSNCFKYPSRVVPATRSKVLETAARLGYVPNLIAGNLASGRSNIVAVVTPSIRNSNFAGMILGLEDALSAKGYHLIISVIEAPEREYEAVRTLVGRRVDGIVLTGVDREESTRRLLQQAATPVVETWDLNGPFIDMGVGFSTKDGARDATRLMIEKGYRRIGFAGFDGRRNRRHQERMSGFREAMTEAGLQDDLLSFVPEPSGFAGGKIAMEQLLEREPQLEGLFCVTDVLATGALFECMRRGWPVPQRFGVMGFGDYEIAAEVPPGLTTVHTPGDKIGEAAANMIVSRVEGLPTGAPVVDVGYSLTIRGSV